MAERKQEYTTMEEHLIKDQLSNLDIHDDNAQVVVHQAQALLVQELNSMSIDERNGVFQDIHGVADCIEETKDFVNSKLLLLENELSNIQSGNESFLMAKQQSLDYVANEKFRLKFLRAFSFDEKASAVGIVRFFEEKHLFFGNEKLVKDICLSDMNDEDIACITSGYCMLLSCRDRSGRPILFFNAALRGDSPRESLLRCVYYFFMSAVEEESNQKHGVVLIGLNGKRNTLDAAMALRLGSLTQVLPLRIAAFHFCSNSIFSKLFRSIAMLAVSKNVRQRIRDHCGTIKECILEIQSYGIPHVILPIDLEGNYDNTGVKEWCEMRKLMEEAKQHESTVSASSTSSDTKPLSNTGSELKKTEINRKESNSVQSSSDDTTLPGDMASLGTNKNQVVPEETDNDIITTKHNNKNEKDDVVVIAIPGYYDVLFGRGKAIITHPGNLRFHQLLDLHETRFESANKTGKSLVASEIVKVIWGSNGRFLKQNGTKGGWVEVSQQEAQGKVSQAYRTRRSSVLSGVNLGAQRAAAMAVLGMQPISLSNFQQGVGGVGAQPTPSKRFKR